MGITISTTCPSCNSNEWIFELNGGTIIYDSIDEDIKCPLCGAELLVEVEVHATLISDLTK